MLKNKKRNKIITYQWQGINRQGEKLEGIMVAPDTATVHQTLRQQGIIKKKISKQPRRLFANHYSKITTNDITLFSRQMATMSKAGLSLLQSFDVFIKSCNNQAMRHLIHTIKNDVEKGLTLAESFNQYPQFFNALFCNLVNAGEKSGSLALMLTKIATYKEKMAELKRKIKKILTYPCIVLLITCIVTAALLILVIPQFELLFKNFNAKLPLLTQAVIALSRLIQAHWLFITGSIISIMYTLVYLFQHSQKFSQNIDKLLLKIPFVGNILRKTIIARFAHTLSMIYTTGLPLLDALTLVADISNHVTYRKAIHHVHTELVGGQTLQTALANTGLFPLMAVQMIAIGEESGTLEQMLLKVADYYEEEMDLAINTLNNLLEPIIMSLLGLLIGSLVIAMYLPVFKLGSMV